MRRVLGLIVTLAATSVLLIAPAHANRVGNEGCTPGFWKNHPSRWQEATPSKALHFELVKAAVNLDGDRDTDTFMDALRYQGGPGLEGAKRILLRAAVAAWLNAASEELGYPLRRYGEDGFVADVKAALASGNRQTMLNLAERLDRLNNLGCPL
jgi:hypothetical protein